MCKRRGKLRYSPKILFIRVLILPSPPVLCALDSKTLSSFFLMYYYGCTCSIQGRRRWGGRGGSGCPAFCTCVQGKRVGLSSSISPLQKYSCMTVVTTTKLQKHRENVCSELVYKLYTRNKCDYADASYVRH